jgi:hypothetical protein
MLGATAGSFTSRLRAKFATGWVSSGNSQHAVTEASITNGMRRS